MQRIPLSSRQCAQLLSDRTFQPSKPEAVQRREAQVSLVQSVSKNETLKTSQHHVVGSLKTAWTKSSLEPSARCQVEQTEPTKQADTPSPALQPSQPFKPSPSQEAPEASDEASQTAPQTVSPPLEPKMSPPQAGSCGCYCQWQTCDLMNDIVEDILHKT